MFRPRLPRLAAAALMLAALATAGPARAASNLDGFYSTGPGDGLSMKVKTIVTYDPVTAAQIVTSRGFATIYYASGSWAVCTGTLVNGPRGGTGTYFTCELTGTRNGQPLGGTYREAEGFSAGSMVVDFYEGVITAPGISTSDHTATISKTVLPNGGLALGPIANAPPTTVYVSHIKNHDDTYEADELGSGWFIETQGTAFRLGGAVYDDTGAQMWVTLDGTCVMNANFICTVTGPLTIGNTGVAFDSNVIVQPRNNGSILLILPTRPVADAASVAKGADLNGPPPNRERRLGPYDAWN